MQVQELVAIVPWNFIATICNLFIQMYLIKRFLFKPINEMLEKRKAKADAEIQDAVKAKEDAQAMKTEYEKNMAGSKKQSKRDRHHSTAVQLLFRAKKCCRKLPVRLAAMKAKAEKDIAQEKT